MSRAFVREDSEEQRPKLRFALPPREDPSYDAAAAAALLEGARVSEVLAAEEATGYRWGDARLSVHVERVRDAARAEGDERLEQVAERFLRQASQEPGVVAPRRRP